MNKADKQLTRALPDLREIVGSALPEDGKNENITPGFQSMSEEDADKLADIFHKVK
jgi:hypothetical protein